MTRKYSYTLQITQKSRLSIGPFFTPFGVYGV